VVSNTRIANWANQNGVIIARLQDLQPVLRHHRPLPKIPFGTPVVVLDLELQATVKFGNCLESCNPLRYDLRADAVTGHYCKVVVPHSSIFSFQQESSAKVIIRAFEAADTTGSILKPAQKSPACIAPDTSVGSERSPSSFVALFARVVRA